MTPFLNSDYLEEEMNFSASASHRALTQLSESGVIREITGRKSNRVWVAADVVDELKSLELRIAERRPHQHFDKAGVLQTCGFCNVT